MRARFSVCPVARLKLCNGLAELHLDIVALTVLHLQLFLEFRNLLLQVVELCFVPLKVRDQLAVQRLQVLDLLSQLVHLLCGEVSRALLSNDQARRVVFCSCGFPSSRAYLANWTELAMTLWANLEHILLLVHAHRVIVRKHALKFEGVEAEGLAHLRLLVPVLCSLHRKTHTKMER